MKHLAGLVVTVVAILCLTGVALYGVNTWKNNKEAERMQEYDLVQQKLCIDKIKNEKLDVSFTYYQPEHRCVYEMTDYIPGSENWSSFFNYYIFDAFTGTQIAFIADGEKVERNHEACLTYNALSLTYFNRKGPVNCE